MDKMKDWWEQNSDSRMGGNVYNPPVAAGQILSWIIGAIIVLGILFVLAQ